MHKLYIKKEKQEIIQNLLDSKYATADVDGNVFSHRHGGKFGTGWLKNPKKTGLIDYKGYVISKFMVDGKGVRISNHHIIWINFNGFIPEGLQINHKDGIKHDNELSNLELMTPRENTWHAVSTGKRKHKLNDIIVEDIRNKYKTNNYTQKELGKMYNVDASAISRIVRYEFYKDY